MCKRKKTAEREKKLYLRRLYTGKGESERLGLSMKAEAMCGLRDGESMCGRKASGLAV